jgi:hypothetical protein
VIFFSTDGVLFFLVAEGNLEGAVAISFLRFNLSNDAGTGFNNRTGSLLAALIEDAGHPNFLTNDSFHFLTVFPRKVIQDSILTGMSSFPPGADRDNASILVHHPTFSFIALLRRSRFNGIQKYR